MRAILLVAAAVFLINFIASGIVKINTPFFERDERWQGVHLIAAVRLIEGQTLYPDYDSEGGYYAYAPFVPIVQAAALELFGANLVTLKALTFIVTLLCLAGVAVAAFHLTRSCAAAFVAAAIFAGTYRFLIEWHWDIRPDPFSTAMCLWGMIVAHKWLRSPGGWALNASASALFVLAALSKQNFLLVPVAYVVFAGFARGTRAAIIAFIPFLVLIGGALWYFDVGGEHMYGTIAVMRNHQMKSGVQIYQFLTRDLPLITLPLAISVAGLLALGNVDISGASKRLFVLMYLAALVVGVTPVLKEAGAVNSLFYFCAMMAVLAVAGIWRLTPQAGPSPAMLAAALLFMSIEMVASFTFWQSQEWEAFLQPAYNFAVRHKNERVYFPRSNYVTYLAAGQYYPDDNMTWDRDILCRVGVPHKVIDMIETQHWDYIIGEFYSGELNAVREKYYEPLPDPAGAYTVFRKRRTPLTDVPSNDP
jgi:hypothetical protein